MSSVLILSDLWGKQNDQWLSAYIPALQNRFEELIYLDCQSIGGIDTSLKDEKLIHAQFLDYGLANAIEHVLALELKSDTLVLGFSIGGTIAWKAMKRGMKVSRAFLLSATRLRYESESIDTPVHLFFGEHDTHRPDTEQICILSPETHELISSQGHRLYQDPKIAMYIIEQMTES